MYKAPVLGLVKTRLAADSTVAFALDVYRKLGAHTFEHCQSDSVESWVFYSPADQVDLLTDWIPGASYYRPQAEGDLGARLLQASAEAFATTQGRIKQIVMGADCPFIDQALLDHAWRELDHNDLVIGPTFDGGYYLIGMNAPQAQVFQNISWSSEQVFAQTLEAAAASALRTGILPKHHDVDTMKEWELVKDRVGG